MKKQLDKYLSCINSLCEVAAEDGIEIEFESDITGKTAGMIHMTKDGVSRAIKVAGYQPRDAMSPITKETFEQLLCIADWAEQTAITEDDSLFLPPIIKRLRKYQAGVMLSAKEVERINDIYVWLKGQL